MRCVCWRVLRVVLCRFLCRAQAPGCASCESEFVGVGLLLGCGKRAAHGLPAGWQCPVFVTMAMMMMMAVTTMMTMMTMMTMTMMMTTVTMMTITLMT